MNEHCGAVVWFTGLSGAGKTTLAKTVAERLMALGWAVEMIDGDELRRGLSADLGFSRCDREENVRRAACLAEVLVRHTDFVLVAMIAPYRSLRAKTAATFRNYHEVYVNAPLEICEARDPKGLYRRVRLGQMRWFSGFDDPYEAPLEPELECRTDLEDKELSAKRVLDMILRRGFMEEPERLVGSALDKFPGITLAALARSLGIGQRTLSFRLRRSAGRSFRNIREQHLVTRAQQLLSRGLPVKQVSFNLGFGSPEAFEHFFRRATGAHPSSVRRASQVAAK